jgi:hypothetical protein
LRFFAAETTIEQLGAIATHFSGGLVRDNPEANERVAEMTALGRAGGPEGAILTTEASAALKRLELVSKANR